MPGSAHDTPALDWHRHIAVDADILIGKPVIRGTRIAVELLLDRLGDGWSMEDILAAYPHLTREQVLAAVRFATEVFRDERFFASTKTQR